MRDKICDKQGFYICGERTLFDYEGLQLAGPPASVQRTFATTHKKHKDDKKNDVWGKNSPREELVLHTT